MLPARSKKLCNALGRLAQLVERLPYKQDVTGSSPVPPISGFLLLLLWIFFKDIFPSANA